MPWFMNKELQCDKYFGFINQKLKSENPRLYPRGEELKYLGRALSLVLYIERVTL